MEHSSGKKISTRSRKYTALILVIVFAVGTIQALSGRSVGITAQIDDRLLGVLGAYGDPLFIPLEEITQVQLVDAADFGSRLEGEEKNGILSGVYQSEEWGTYTLHVYQGNPPYIAVRYGDGNTLLFNQRTPKLTRGIYEDLTGT